MAKLTYWVARCTGDSELYSIRAKTKREVVAALNSGRYRVRDFEKPYKCTVEYRDAFDLMDLCSNEGRGWWELPPLHDRVEG